MVGKKKHLGKKAISFLWIFAVVLSLMPSVVNPITVHATTVDADNAIISMEAVPIYRLSCNMEHEAAKVAYEGMQG